MRSIPTPIVLDGYIGLLERAGYNRYQPSPGLSGKMRSRALMMVNAGLIKSRTGQAGGYMRERELSHIALSEILTLWSPPTHPLARLFYTWGDCSIQEVLGWTSPYKSGADVTFHAALAILSMLSETEPMTVRTISDAGLVSGYTAIFLSRGARLGFLKCQLRKGYVLTKPFDKMTVGDICPVLSHRGKISSAILSRSRDILLKNIYR